MKLIINKEQIIKGLQKASSLTSQKTGTTFLKAIWLKWNNEEMNILATDSKIEFISTYKIKSDGEGLIGINGKSFYELIKKLPPGEVSISYNNDENEWLSLEQGQKKYKILTYDSSWFRDFIEFPIDGYVKWQGDEFKDLITRLYYFISDEIDDDSRYLKISRYEEKNKIVAHAMLKHSFAMKIIEHEELYNLFDRQGFLIDKVFLNELKKWLENNEIYLSIKDNRIFVKDEINNERISFPIIKKETNDYSIYLKPFQEYNLSTMVVFKDELRDVFDRLNIFVSDIDEIVKFIFNNNELIIFSESYDKGEARESLLVEYEGELNEIIFYIKRTRDIISHFNSEKIKFEFTHEEGPVKITGIDDIDKDYLIITMPIQIKEEVYYEDEIEDDNVYGEENE